MKSAGPVAIIIASHEGSHFDWILCPRSSCHHSVMFACLIASKSLYPRPPRPGTVTVNVTVVQNVQRIGFSWEHRQSRPGGYPKCFNNDNNRLRATTSVPTTYNYTPGPATPTTSTGTSYRSVPFSSVHQRTATHSRFVRKNKACKHYTRDVVCLPFSSASTFRIPRGDSRANLARNGLIGKISFTSDWSKAQLKEEMTAIFRRTFALSMGQSFPFEYLSTVKGCKRLMKPNVSSSFLWGGKEVASISSATCLYLMASINIPVQLNSLHVSTGFQLWAAFQCVRSKNIYVAYFASNFFRLTRC